MDTMKHDAAHCAVVSPVRSEVTAAPALNKRLTTITGKWLTAGVSPPREAVTDLTEDEAAAANQKNCSWSVKRLKHYTQSEKLVHPEDIEQN